MPPPTSPLNETMITTQDRGQQTREADKTMDQDRHTDRHTDETIDKDDKTYGQFDTQTNSYVK